MTPEICHQLENDSLWIETMKYIHKGKDIDQAIKEAYGHLMADEDRLKSATVSDFKRLVNSWLSRKPQLTQKPKRDISNL